MQYQWPMMAQKTNDANLESFESESKLTFVRQQKNTVIIFIRMEIQVRTENRDDGRN